MLLLDKILDAWTSQGAIVWFHVRYCIDYV